ncbi:hypothetical protein [Pseudomonas frederiksbergensis]|uniref:hypothetical protein n=1 Tax=Pseudomonas frederiksbergensis TaxID=104087 RepID=UPI001616C70F|nr:hypothetical protein [Pseudomonas frederiksbergensis]
MSSETDQVTHAARLVRKQSGVKLGQHGTKYLLDGFMLSDIAPLIHVFRAGR